jgi:hypothetical protein
LVSVWVTEGDVFGFIRGWIMKVRISVVPTRKAVAYATLSKGKERCSAGLDSSGRDGGEEILPIC